MDGTRVLYRLEDGGVALATLNRPAVRNPIDEQTRAELQAILDRVADDLRDIEAAVSKIDMEGERYPPISGGMVDR